MTRAASRCLVPVLAALSFGCGGEPARDVEFALPSDEYAIADVRVIALETGKNLSLEEARFDLRSFLSRSRRDAPEVSRALSSPAFFPAPRGYAWFAIDRAARVAVAPLVSAERLALGRIDDGLELSLRDFAIHGEEDANGERAIRLSVVHGRADEFRTLLERAGSGQILFVVPGRVLLAVDVAAPVDGEFWLLDLPPRGESAFVDRLARSAIRPS